VLTLIIALLIAYGWSLHAWPVFVLEFMVGIAALSVGALVGFLFGIPRSRTHDTPAEQSGNVPDSQGPGYGPSTNLEQVSDWLTKILVGVGLVEFNKFREALGSAGEFVAASLNPRVASANIVSQLVMVAFATLGFLASFLWTRVYYGNIQFRADEQIWSRLNKLANRVGESEEDSQKAVKLASLVAKQTQPQSVFEPEAVGTFEFTAETSARVKEVFKKIEQFKKAPAEFNSNPTGDLGPTSSAAIAVCSAAVPEVTASAYFVSMRAAHSFSNRATFDLSGGLLKRNGLWPSSTSVSCVCSLLS
jgi:hypothetical protein